MSDLQTIYWLLREEYARSRHLFWQDESTGRIVNDVTETLGLVARAAHCIQTGSLDDWKTLVRYALHRSMSPSLMEAIGVYLQDVNSHLPPLPPVNIAELAYRNWRGGVMPLIDESDQPQVKAPAEKPEPQRIIATKHDHQWSHYTPRTRATAPNTRKEQNSITYRQHWLF